MVERQGQDLDHCGRVGCSQHRGDSLRGEEAHQKVCMAKDLCPGFMDYFWMGHFYHKVRVPRKRDVEGEGLGEESGLLSSRFLRVWRDITAYPGSGGKWDGGSILVYLYVHRDSERVKALSDTGRREAVLGRLLLWATDLSSRAARSWSCRAGGTLPAIRPGSRFHTKTSSRPSSDP